jgi:hypothetical protein
VIAPVSPAPSPFAGVSNLFTITEPAYTGGLNGYYAWSQQGTIDVLTLIGFYYTNSTVTTWEYCAPGYVTFEVPIPASWSGYPSGGTCTTTDDLDSQAGDPTEYAATNAVTNSNGSYTLTFSYNFTAFTSGDIGSGTWQVDAAGDANVTSSDPDGDFANESFVLNAPAPVSNSATVPIAYVVYPAPSTLPSPLPSPIATTAPNPWQSLPSSLNGMPPKPLQSDVYTNEGTIAPSNIPTACGVPSNILSSNSSLTHVQENAHYSDPLGLDGPNYESSQTDYYLLAGIGVVCIAYNQTGYEFDGSAMDWYDGNDRQMDAFSRQEVDYITSTSLSAQLTRTRSMSAAAAQASRSFVAASRAHDEGERRKALAAARKRRAARGARFSANLE